MSADSKPVADAEEDMEFDYSNEPTAFCCPACPSTFVTRISLSRHMIYHVNDPKFTCSFCQAIFYKKDALADHISTKHGGAKFSCHICQRNVSRRDHLTRHYRNVHGITDSAETLFESLAPAPTTNNGVQETIQVETQNSATESNENPSSVTPSAQKLDVSPGLQKPLSSVYENDSEVGEDEFEDGEDDYSGFNDGHPSSMLEITVGEPDPGEIKYENGQDANSNGFYSDQTNGFQGVRMDRKRQCPQCSASFTNQYNLDRHVESHNSTRPHRCEICPDNRGFIRKEHLTKHMSSVHSGMKFTCEYCGKDISRKDHLIRHIKNVHPAEYLGIPPDVAATHDINMSLNSLKASGMVISEKTLQSMQPKPKQPFVPCDMCSETFPQLNDLLEHQRTAHADVRKYSCEYCPKSFKRREHLQKHVVLHTGSRDFSCNLCGKEFPRKDALQDHIRRIHGPEPSDVVEFTCKYCQKKFLSKANLRRHIETSHNQKPKLSSLSVNSASFSSKNGQGFHLPDSTSVLPPVPSLFPISAFSNHSAFSRNVYGGLDTGLCGRVDNFSCAHCTKSFSDETIFKQHLITHRLKQ